MQEVRQHFAAAGCEAHFEHITPDVALDVDGCVPRHTQAREVAGAHAVVGDEHGAAGGRAVAAAIGQDAVGAHITAGEARRVDRRHTHVISLTRREAHGHNGALGRGGLQEVRQHFAAAGCEAHFEHITPDVALDVDGCVPRHTQAREVAGAHAVVGDEHGAAGGRAVAAAIGQDAVGGDITAGEARAVDGGHAHVIGLGRREAHRNKCRLRRGRLQKVSQQFCPAGGDAHVEGIAGDAAFRVVGGVPRHIQPRQVAGAQAVVVDERGAGGGTHIRRGLGQDAVGGDITARHARVVEGGHAHEISKPRREGHRHIGAAGAHGWEVQQHVAAKGCRAHVQDKTQQAGFRVIGGVPHHVQRGEVAGVRAVVSRHGGAGGGRALHHHWRADHTRSQIVAAVFGLDLDTIRHTRHKRQVGKVHRGAGRKHRGGGNDAGNVVDNFHHIGHGAGFRVVRPRNPRRRKIGAAGLKRPVHKHGHHVRWRVDVWRAAHRETVLCRKTAFGEAGAVNGLHAPEKGARAAAVRKIQRPRKGAAARPARPSGNKGRHHVARHGRGAHPQVVGDEARRGVIIHTAA